MERKTEDFWKYVTSFEFVGLTETWAGQKGWERMRETLPKRFTWSCQEARKEKRKGKARGGIIIGIREGWEEIEETRTRGTRGKKSKNQ